MENTLQSIITNGLSLESVWSLVVLMIVAFMVIAIKNRLTSYADYRTLKGNRYIAQGAMVRLPTSTGFVDGEIVEISPSKVVVKTLFTFEHIPVSQFARGRKSLLIVPQPSTWGNQEPEAETSL